MSSRILSTLVASLFVVTTQAQINTQLPDTYKVRPTPYTVTNPAQFNTDITVLDYTVVRNFKEAADRPEPNLSHILYVHKHFRINTQKGADSSATILIPKEDGAEPIYMEARVIAPDGTISQITGRLRKLNGADGKEFWTIKTPALTPGSELEYDLASLVYDALAGADLFQEDVPVVHARFRLVTPNILKFDVKSLNGFGEVTSAQHGQTTVFDVEANNIPAFPNSAFVFPKPLVQGVSFGMRSFVNMASYKRETVEYNWQDYGEREYISYYNIDKNEYTRLQKEMEGWLFIRQRKSLPLLIYQVEHYLKSIIKYEPAKNIPDLENLGTILKNRMANDLGMVRLMAAVYYNLGIRAELLLASQRDELPIDTSLCTFYRAKNVLLYFPELNQAIAPTERDYHFPNIPPMWSNTLALHAWDSATANASVVKTNFMRVPVGSYANNGIRMSVDVKFSPSNDSLLVNTTQLISGDPEVTLKAVLNTPKINTTQVLTSNLPLSPTEMRNLSVTVANQDWSPTMISRPLEVRASFSNTSILKVENNGYSIDLRELNRMPVDNLGDLPAAGQPINITFPFYQETKISIALPAGYKVKNAASFNSEYVYKEGDDEVVGYRLKSLQSDQTFTLLLTQWYAQTDYQGKAREGLEKVLRTLLQLREVKVEIAK
ncbi:uncharacterized protein DUF3857 [Chitinophaga skermanii]|uniref:Uncharacterized protein DUF3857 n=1 Tax=Chitinophaga skermanii TaxID=331697 RepID=A0A327Q5Z7_9BACT|nr:DUF3857 domain-containing protein [Chitinophaga skermanii]RAI99394.1 uncharacterized protein DUF3857 [Chitinophaga skermanii]